MKTKLHKVMIMMALPSVVLPRPAWQEKMQFVEPFSSFRLKTNHQHFIRHVWCSPTLFHMVICNGQVEPYFNMLTDSIYKDKHRDKYRNNLWTMMSIHSSLGADSSTTGTRTQDRLGKLLVCGWFFIMSMTVMVMLMTLKLITWI